MTRIQSPSVAGTFYPGEAAVLQNDVDHLLEQAKVDFAANPKALIAPHAGYVYSGPIAATAYRSIEAIANNISRVVVIAPSHRVGFRGLAISSAEYFKTPLGDIPVDHEALSKIWDLPQVSRLDQVFANEHALEVQLPFLQRALGSFSLVPLIAGDASPESVAEVFEKLWGGDETLFVISSDLSHYHDYATAQTRDQKTTNAIEHLSSEHIGSGDACGRVPVKGLLHIAAAKGLQVKTLDLRNSGDTAGTKDRVVGYGAYAFY